MISFVVPAYNEELLIGATVRALVEAGSAREFLRVLVRVGLTGGRRKGFKWWYEVRRADPG